MSKARKTFTRTSHGLQNYNMFYSSDIVIYIEGRSEAIEESNEDDYDYKYYKSLCNVFAENKKIKIKQVGSKKDVFDYYEKIISNDIQNSIVCVDKDYDDIFCTILECPKLITTYGYSWENDFWTNKLCEKVLNSLGVKKIEHLSAYQEKTCNALRRVEKISRINSVAYLFGKSIYTSSRTAKSKGLGIGKGKWPVSKDNFKRARVRFQEVMKDENIDCYMPIIKKELKAMNNNFSFFIQGHLLEYIVVSLIGCIYKEVKDNSSCPICVIKDIAFSAFEECTEIFLSKEAFSHYEKQFSKL